VDAEEFRALHHGPRPLVLPNVWDAVSARAFAGAGFPVLATTSAAVAATLGYPDGERTPIDEAFAAITRIVRSVDVPVTADVEAGYGLAPNELVERLLETGAVGCNVEDSYPASDALKDPDRHADWLAEVRAAAGPALVLNARVDVFLSGGTVGSTVGGTVGGTVEDAIARGRRYRDAGADCIFPIFAPTDRLRELAEGIDAPVNALHLPDGPSPARLGELGAARVTFGGGLHRRIAAAVTDLARELWATAS